MKSVGVHEAKTNLSQLLVRVQTGEEIEIRRGKEPVARLVPIPRTGKRILGTEVGKFVIPDSFYEPMTEKELALWYDAPFDSQGDPED